MSAKISKIMVWPSYKVNLGNYSTVDLNAGVEIVFDKPVAMDSKELQTAFDEARKITREEFKKQYEPYKAQVIKKDKKPEGGEK